MICQHCGATIPENSNFCTYCGAVATQQCEAKPQYIGARRLNLAKLLGDTFTLYGRHFGIMCVVGLIYVGIPAIFEIYSIATENHIFEMHGVFNEKITLFSIFSLLVQCYVSIWVIRQCLYIARGGIDLQWNQIFPSFGKFLKFLALNLVFGFAILFSALPAFFLTGISFMNDPPIALPIVIACAVGAALLPCYIFARLWLALCFFVDRNMGVIDSVNNAWQASSGNFWKLFTSIIIFSVCTFCGAMVFTAPAFAFDLADDGSVLEALLINIGFILTFPILLLGSCLAYLQLTE